MPFVPYTFTEPDDPAREDDGLFGPGSVTWRIMNSPIMWVAALRALYLQALHPRVIVSCGRCTAPSRQVNCVENGGCRGRYSRGDDGRRADVVRGDRRTAQGAAGDVPRRAQGRAARVPGRADRGRGPAAPGPFGN